MVRLNEGLRSGRKLTLVSAPAGFGKTTLLSEWASALGEPNAQLGWRTDSERGLQPGTDNRRAEGWGRHGVAWLSLDENDNEAVRFWSYVVAALQTIAQDIGATTRALFEPPPVSPALSMPPNQRRGTEEISGEPRAR